MIDLQEIKINNIKYWFFCETSFPEKCSGKDDPALKVTLIIDKIEDGKERKRINWEDFKDSYLAEKISDYVKNTINGHRAIYLENDPQKLPKNVIKKYANMIDDNVDYLLEYIGDLKDEFIISTLDSISASVKRMVELSENL